MKTGRKVQQAMFLENLWKEMDRLSSSDPRSMVKTAAQYLSDGYGHGEVVELLVADGFDMYMSKSCVQKLAEGNGSEEMSESDGPEWGFEAEDNQRGDVVSNFDVGCHMVKAAKEEIAWEKAQTFLDENCSAQYSVTRVIRL